MWIHCHRLSSPLWFLLGLLLSLLLGLLLSLPLGLLLSLPLGLLLPLLLGLLLGLLLTRPFTLHCLLLHVSTKPMQTPPLCLLRAT